MAILGAATCLIIFFIGREAWGPMAGSLAAALLALNPLMLTSCRRAMVDAPALFFSALGMLLVIRALKTREDPGRGVSRLILLASLLGVVFGLAAASKLNTLAAAAAGAASLALIAWRRHGAPATMGALAVALVTGVAVFVAVNPYLYAEPLQRGWAMLTYLHYEAGIESMAERSAMVVRRLLIGQTDPQGLTYLTFRSATQIPLEWVLLPVGVLMAAMSGLGSFRRRPGMSAAPARLTIFMWWLVSLTAIAAWLPHDWERYYLPALPPATLLIAGALAALISRGLKIAGKAVG